jgi:hypothetical protein
MDDTNTLGEYISNTEGYRGIPRIVVDDSNGTTPTPTSITNDDISDNTLTEHNSNMVDVNNHSNTGSNGCRACISTSEMNGIKPNVDPEYYYLQRTWLYENHNNGK